MSDTCSADSTSKMLPEEHAELAAVLASKSFSRAHKHTAILSHICKEYDEGRGAAIKEYTVAISALGRPTDFDPANDSVVRVEVSRLRKRLRQYYASEGSSHEIEIQLPEVGYSPQFIRRAVPPTGQVSVQQSAPAPFVHPLPTSRSRRTWSLIATAFLILAAASAGVLTIQRHTQVRPTPFPSVVVAAVATDAIRIAAGATNPRYVDRCGQVWQADRYFTGGTVVSKPDHRILRTFDPNLYQQAREGEFQYDIPLKPGTYELHLHFSEIVLRESLGSGVEGQRRFDVSANGMPLLTNFDIVLDTPGVDEADERVFRNISRAKDGALHLKFTPVMGKALLSGIELIPNPSPQLLPIRILAASRPVIDRNDQFWGADRHFLGGRSLPRIAQIGGTADPGLFASERFGAFSYFIPVAEGRYAATFYFAESNFGVDNIGVPAGASGGIGYRVFNILCNGAMLAKNFDIYREAPGPLRAVARTFKDLKPNAQGKLIFVFEPVKDYPTLSAIEVTEDSSAVRGRS